MEVKRLLKLLPLYYLSLIASILNNSFSYLPNLKTFLSLVRINDLLLSLYFHFCGLRPCTLDLDPETKIHFWVPNRRTQNQKPSLVLIHGFGGNSKWQFYTQVGSLSRTFDLYIPDLVFFGGSYSKGGDRSDGFQARCVGEGLRRLGVDRFSVFGVSYGGYVAYRMAEIYREVVEKVVILSCGIICTPEQAVEEVEKVGRDVVVESLVPKSPEGLRFLRSKAMFRAGLWVPDFLLQDFINVMYTTHREEKIELLLHLLQSKGKPVPVLQQETLILWGDKDCVFPLYFGYQMAEHLGKKAVMEIIKNAGHAANLESPGRVNGLVKSFILGSH